ncbi:sensor histidine kinase [Pseudacidovorax sp. RU35E]|uniref:sensor histidine kinase n=1 Tax=Pseudacidovorax sp. RU35E TaxID=1907403 RepID=UPI000955930E|nr:sensor histidine kinase [Pseudacidovorax sp. RU35E]SIR61327.1 two-component system, OmpR family, sensor histidine kinase TctE [Pseudacidovorax sp. RU35E]
MRGALRHVQGLRHQLLVRLMAPLLLMVVVAGMAGIWYAREVTERVFDRWLLDAARSVQTLVRRSNDDITVDHSPQLTALLLYDDLDRAWFSVTQDDRLLAGQAGLPSTGTGEVWYRRGSAFDAQFQGHAVRVVRVELEGIAGSPVVVLMAETLRKRVRAEKELMTLLWPMVALLAAAYAAIVVAVRRTTVPLAAVARRWKDQSQESLAPIALHDVPQELEGFARSHNELLGRIRTMLERERQFAATAAHQLRTTLTGLQLGLSRAQGLADHTAMREAVAQLGHGIQQSSRLVQQLLTLGALDPEGGRDMVRADTDLVDLAQGVGAVLMEQAIDRGMDLELAAPHGPVHAPIQPDLVAEALSNVLDNALRYTPRGGRVLVEVLQRPARIVVQDSGPGIDLDERHLVLDRYVRGRRAPSEGSGLGLAIVRDVMALHGGSVELGDSAWQGLKVTLRFPDTASA